MKQKYPGLSESTNSVHSGFSTSIFKKFLLASTFAAALLMPAVMHSQVTYTLGTENTSSTTLGVTPFSTSNMNSRSQYLYLAEELLDQGAISGNIISIAVNITSLALPSALKPENVSIKMGTTPEVTLDNTIIENLPVYYSAPVVNITSTGWYTFTLNMPFEWDGLRNIIVEVCRNNDEIGTSFGVETTFFNQTDYRTTGLYTNDATPGCTLTGTSPMTNPERRIRPNLRVVMTNPCDGTPVAGVTAVSGSNYCSGSPFTLSVTDGSIESGLYYQWQWAPLNTGPWNDLPGANSGTYTTSQAISTWYRRATICIASQQTINSFPLLVGGAGCYCAAEVSTQNPDIGITNVSFNTINNDSDSSVSYTNYTTTQTSVTQGETYPLSVRVNTNGGTNYTKAWIDWNKDGLYDSNEGYSLGNVTGGSDVNSGMIANVTIPLTAVPGTTNMRIRTSQGSTNVEPEACNTIETGEGEDYTLNILDDFGVQDISNSAGPVLVQADPSGLSVRVQNASIATVTVYDISGRMLATKSQINAENVIINVSKTHQVLLVKVQTTDGTIINKKVIL
jgi:hypothetical protein